MTIRAMMEPARPDCQRHRYPQGYWIVSGPIVIGQAMWFEYSGPHAFLDPAARMEYEVSSSGLQPGHDHDRPGFADRTYIDARTPSRVLAPASRYRPAGAPGRVCRPSFDIPVLERRGVQSTLVRRPRETSSVELRLAPSL